MDDTTKTSAQDSRIDTRILKHLLEEVTEMLEEAQTHALVEKQGGSTAYVLSRTTWRMTATCLWAMGELFPAMGETDQSAQLHAPAPVLSCDDVSLSPQMKSFIMRVDRLHERARRLDELSRGPIISTATAAPNRIVTSDDMPKTEETRQVASIIPLFGAMGGASHARISPVEQARTEVRLAMANGD